MDRDQILLEIKEKHVGKIVRRYAERIKSADMDRDDLEQIFLIACHEAMDTVDPNIGDPLMFILQSGRWAVAGALRNSYQREHRYHCRSCNKTSRPKNVGGVRECRKCGSRVDELIEAIRRTDSIEENPVTLGNGKKSIEMEVEERELVEEFEKRLTGRKADIFRLIFHEGYDRESCQNYQKEIAEILGVAPANINLRLRQIKEAWRKYKEELA